ncbi:hypothetical protein BGZ65_007637, partial [Modicella reniformis]
MVLQKPLLMTPVLTTKFIANLKGQRGGHYVVHWRIKLLDGFSLPNGLRFSVSVSYDELEELSKKHPHGLDLDLMLEELVAIPPHEMRTTIVLSLSNSRSERRFEYSGLQVDFVEIRPFVAVKEGQTPEPQGEAIRHIVKRATKSKCYPNYAEAPQFWTLEPSETSSDIPITRLA